MPMSFLSILLDVFYVFFEKQKIVGGGGEQDGPKKKTLSKHI
jgi:hypothetical protein